MLAPSRLALVDSAPALAGRSIARLDRDFRPIVGSDVEPPASRSANGRRANRFPSAFAIGIHNLRRARRTRSFPTSGRQSASACASHLSDSNRRASKTFEPSLTGMAWTASRVSRIRHARGRLRARCEVSPLPISDARRFRPRRARRQARLNALALRPGAARDCRLRPPDGRPHSRYVRIARRHRRARA